MSRRKTGITRRPQRWRIVIRDASPPPAASIVVDYGATWKYQNGDWDHDAGFQAPAFDDSAWPSGPGGYGYDDPSHTWAIAFHGAEIATVWSDPTPIHPANPSDRSDITLRKTVVWPSGAPACRFVYGIDDEVWFYIDGVEVGHYHNYGPSKRGDFQLVVAAPSPGTHIFAVRARNKETTSPLWTNSAFFDTKIEALLDASATYSAPARIVQQVATSGGGTSTFPNPVTAGNILIALQGSRGMSSVADFGLSAIGPSRPFTPVAADVAFNAPWNDRKARLSYRVATGDEQTMYQTSRPGPMLYELEGVTEAQVLAGTVLRIDNAGWSGTKTLGTLTGGNKHLAFMVTIADETHWTFAWDSPSAGWTFDLGAMPDNWDSPWGTFSHAVNPSNLVAQVVGPGAAWAGIAIDIAGNVGGWSTAIPPLGTKRPGDVVAMIDSAQNVGVSEFHNGGGELHFTLPTLHAWCPAIKPWKTHWAYEVYRGTGWHELNSGWIVDMDSGENDTIFYGDDYLAVLGLVFDERFNPTASPEAEAQLWPDDPALHPDVATSGSKYSNQQIDAIIIDQLQRAIHAPNSPLGFFEVGAIATMAEQVTIYATVTQRLQFIVGLLDSHRAGTGKRTRLYAKHDQLANTYSWVVEDNPGEDRPDLKFKYGDLVQGYRVIPFGDFGTRVLGLGRKINGTELLYAIGEAPNVSEDDFARLPKVQLWTDLVDLNDLKRRVRQYAAQIGALGKSVGLGLRTNIFAIKDDWVIGDSAPVDIKRGPIDTASYTPGLWTIWGWALTVVNTTQETVILSLLPKMAETGALDAIYTSSDPVDTTPATTIAATDPTTNVDGVAPSRASIWVNTTTGHIWIVDPVTGFWVDQTAGGGAGYPIPAIAVVSETSYGQLPAVGTANGQYARGDHTHGTPPVYVHDQLVPASTWTIAHNLGKFPAVDVVDSANTVVVGEIVYIDLNHVEVHFSFAFGGRAFCN